jgi:hypothetical protein
MNPLRFQSICLAAISMPFALRGFIATDTAAWATALAALLCGGVVFALDWLTDNGIF